MLASNYSGFSLEAGTDEAGRGCLSGPVVAAAVILMPDHRLVGLNDSKQLSELKRETLFEQIKAQSLAFCIARATVEEIERYNILQATMMAMTRALNGLKKKPQGVLIDGNRVPKGLKMPSVAIVKGDSRVHAISAASIWLKSPVTERWLKHINSIQNMDLISIKVTQQRNIWPH